MARKRAKESEEGKPGFALVTQRSFEDPRRFVTMGADHEVTLGDATWARGAFVRLQPGVEDEDAHVEAVKQALLGMGAIAVRVLPRPRSEPLVEAAMAPATRRESLREAVQHVLRSAATVDRGALEERVERAAARVGL